MIAEIHRLLKPGQPQRGRNRKTKQAIKRRKKVARGAGVLILGVVAAFVLSLSAAGGVFLVITYGQPSARLPHLERKQYSWNVTHVALGTTRFMYACQKRHPKSDG
jgi:hypothetical protein